MKKEYVTNELSRAPAMTIPEQAVERLLAYAKTLDLTERPSTDEYDVTADIRAVCAALPLKVVQRPDRDDVARAIYAEFYGGDPDIDGASFKNAFRAADAVLALFPVWVQRPEDVARPKGFNTVSNARLAVKLRDYKDTLAAEIGSSIEARIKTGSEDVYGIGREIVDGEFVSSLIVAALPHPGQPQEGAPCDHEPARRVLRQYLFLREHNAAQFSRASQSPTPQAGCAKEGWRELLEEALPIMEAASQDKPCMIAAGTFANKLRRVLASPPPPVAESGWQEIAMGLAEALRHLIAANIDSGRPLTPAIAHAHENSSAALDAYLAALAPPAIVADQRPEVK